MKPIAVQLRTSVELLDLGFLICEMGSVRRLSVSVCSEASEAVLGGEFKTVTDSELIADRYY